MHPASGRLIGILGIIALLVRKPIREDEKTNPIDYINRQREWSERTFGHGVRTVGITKHIEKELSEIRAAPHDLTEWVDVVILALDGAWRAGYTAEQIAAELERKQAVNFKRVYPFPVSEDEPSEHIRETLRPSCNAILGSDDTPNPHCCNLRSGHDGPHHCGVCEWEW